MAPYQVTIAYDGTEFKGFQRQRSARTVQCDLENALKKLGWAERTITSAGRTDTGVHAEGQVIAFQLEWKHSTDDLLNALNKHLPVDIRVLRVQYAEADFHPRYSACMRRYRYQVYFGGVENPLLERFYWRVWPKPNLELMNECARLFIGRHDFRVYGKPPNSRSSSFRNVQTANWDLTGDGSQALFRISADAFLYHMVRRIVNVLVRAGQGRISQNEICASLERQLELPAGIAPAKGLILEEIIYK
ncbi:MAG: tRNA pseudouridine(38-40) synthase TruA [Anaerolineae bacterium]|nr:tRNA pseudouridine(38-40) synthase TruA [Anaerolineae bacterium]